MHGWLTIFCTCGFTYPPETEDITSLANSNLYHNTGLHRVSLLFVIYRPESESLPAPLLLFP